ncbi:hypothetical protein SCUP234_04094 [Seiridium cupressi]
MCEITSAPSPAREFHYFPLLPKELRDIIWEYAALPFVPGIHFFKLQTILDVADDGNDRTGSKCVLSVPVHSGFRDGLGFSSNASSYFNELGAWDACCESRQFLEASRSRRLIAKGDGHVLAFRNLITEENMPFAALDGWSGASDEQCLCSYSSHPLESSLGRRRDLLVNLEQDIICLTMDLHNLRFPRDGNELLDIPELRAFKDDFPVRKLALQYHPEWIGGLEGIGPDQEDALRDVLDMFGTYSHLPLLECVYFIDYRIVPKDDWETRAGHSGNAVFRGRGKSFYEVTRDDDRWTLDDDRPFMLAEELAESRSLSRAWSNEDGEAEGQSPQGTKTQRLIEDWADRWGLDQNQECKFKVLACVPSAS